jgi:iron complex transport system ATP-binding protein
MIEAQALGFRFSPQAPWLFEDLSFALAPGETLALLGRNGRGKTTLLKCLARLISPTKGVIRCAGVLGYVPQQFAIPFAYSVFDVVLMGRARHVGLFSNPTARDRARVHEALELVGIDALAAHAITTLSGGERQLALMARALASDVDLLLLDEPVSALDFRNQAIVLSTLRRLAAERGLGILMTTHDPTHALQIADRAIFLYGAGQCEEGPITTMCTETKLSSLYGIAMRKLEHRIGDRPSSSIVADYASIEPAGTELSR